jgi:hypothetical protein
MADYAISNVPRRVVYAASGVGPYAFTFEILVNTDVAVYKDDALLTLTTDYTVTIAANGTGSITLVATPTGATQIAIVGSRAIQRTSDFVTGGDFFANTVNDELDSLTIFAQQNAEGLERALTAPQTDPLNIDMTLPRASVRANKTLAFDSNGDPTTGEVIGDNRGNWASGTAYNKRDIIKDTSNGNVYYANTSHTSSGSQPISSNTDSAKWDLLVDNASAGASATAAAASATAAAGSASAASTSATNAASSASAASTSASGAATSATNAASSATAASGSATTASTQATNASTSATAAATSATNASNSASAASTSASNASSSASAASTSASNASTSATNAANSATSASSSASTATTQATNAASSATAAAGSATAAAGSATTASTQATNASSSATAAAASAAAAAASLDSFDDRYLGPKSSDPTVDNDGNALVTGALYYNTTSQTMKVYDGATWITATAAGTSAMSRYRYVATAGQTTFSGSDTNSLTLSYTSGNIVVARNGAMLDPSEYTASNGTSVVLGVAAGTGDVVDIVAFKSFTVADTYSIAGADAEFLRKAGEDGVTVTGGNVGIGTSSPSTKFVLNGGAQFQGAAGFPTTGTGIEVVGNVNGASNYIQAYNRTASTWQDLVINGNVVAFGTAGSERARIDSSGNVGIGTSSPNYKLTANGGAGPTVIQLCNTASGTTADDGFLLHQDGVNCRLQNTEAGSMLFYTGNTERVRIDSSGNFMVGTTSTTNGAKLSVNGVVYMNNTVYAPGVYSLTTGSAANVHIASDGTLYRSTSSLKYKTDVQDATHGLAQVLALRSVTYKGVNDGAAVFGGLIAEEVHEAGLTEFVQYAEDGTPDALAYANMVSLAFKAIQEQQAIIIALTARVEALEGN